jgi:hypothetical protein
MFRVLVTFPKQLVMFRFKLVMFRFKLVMFRFKFKKGQHNTLTTHLRVQ